MSVVKELAHLEEDEIVERYNQISKEFIELTNFITPHLIKLNKLDKEISILKEEMFRREEK